MTYHITTTCTMSFRTRVIYTYLAKKLYRSVTFFIEMGNYQSNRTPNYVQRNYITNIRTQTFRSFKTNGLYIILHIYFLGAKHLLLLTLHEQSIDKILATLREYLFIKRTYSTIYIIQSV